MDPSTDKSTLYRLPDGREVLVHQPGAGLERSSNWRLTEEAFRRYESWLRIAADKWPSETSFEIPPGMSPNTVGARFRDARQALLLYKYDEALAARHLALADLAVIAMDPSGKLIWFREKGQRGRKGRVTPTVHSVAHRLGPETVIASLPTEPELRAMCVLLHSGRLKGPMTFKGRLDVALVQSVETSFDVAFAYDDVTDTTTLI